MLKGVKDKADGVEVAIKEIIERTKQDASAADSETHVPGILAGAAANPDDSQQK